MSDQDIIAAGEEVLTIATAARSAHMVLAANGWKWADEVPTVDEVADKYAELLELLRNSKESYAFTSGHLIVQVVDRGAPHCSYTLGVEVADVYENPAEWR